MEMTQPGEQLIWPLGLTATQNRSEEHTSELQSHSDLVCRLLLEKKNVAGRNRTWTAKKRESVRAPSVSPPRMTFTRNVPTTGTLPTMLIPTWVAQYAFWSHGSR